MTDSAATPEPRSFDSGRGRLAYPDAGSGEPLVLLHGGLPDHRSWKTNSPPCCPSTG
ncbi:alpha/beta fold hydrolase [Kitasatospora sp. NPDC056783]|uniref:alpha/beta fold hydrolase n=1 Tax=Kitasatospora sp. NPDC056783 TaxID=3345943 RepID=UPI0036C40A28